MPRQSYFAQMARRVGEARPELRPVRPLMRPEDPGLAERLAAAQPRQADDAMAAPASPRSDSAPSTRPTSTGVPFAEPPADAGSPFLPEAAPPRLQNVETAPASLSPRPALDSPTPPVPPTRSHSNAPDPVRPETPLSAPPVKRVAAPSPAPPQTFVQPLSPVTPRPSEAPVAAAPERAVQTPMAAEASPPRRQSMRPTAAAQQEAVPEPVRPVSQEADPQAPRPTSQSDVTTHESPRR